jgi:predicted secreted protein
MGASQAGKQWSAAWLAVLCLTGSTDKTSAAERLGLIVGEAATLRLDANPSTGFAWIVDRDTRNPDAVGVENLGVEKTVTAQGGLVGKPVGQRFRITGRLPGRAIVVFSYVRSWENKRPARQQVYDVDVRAR